MNRIRNGGVDEGCFSAARAESLRCLPILRAIPMVKRSSYVPVSTDPYASLRFPGPGLALPTSTAPAPTRAPSGRHRFALRVLASLVVLLVLATLLDRTEILARLQ